MLPAAGPLKWPLTKDGYLKTRTGEGGMRASGFEKKNPCNKYSEKSDLKNINVGTFLKSPPRFPRNISRRQESKEVAPDVGYWTRNRSRDTVLLLLL